MFYVNIKLCCIDLIGLTTSDVSGVKNLNYIYIYTYIYIYYIYIYIYIYIYNIIMYNNIILNRNR